MKTVIYDQDQVSDVSHPAKLGKPVPRKTVTSPIKASTVWLVVGLILLSAIPLIIGIARLHQLANGAEITPENSRFFASPLPVVLHIVGAIVYALFGAFQFISRLWRRGTGWHRWAGRILVPCGLIVGLSGIWMTLFYPGTNNTAGAAALLFAFRLVFGAGMVFSILFGFIAIRRGDIIRHRAWMSRAYAIGLGAGTQVLTGMIGALVLGTPNELENALLMGSAWAINLAIAEWSLRKRRTPRVRMTSAPVSDVP